MSSQKIKKVVFLGSKPIGYECLQHLISRQEALGYRIEAVLTRQHKSFDGASNLTALAKTAGIPLLQALADVPDCDIIYSVQHHEILTAQTINKAGEIAVNLHMAPLPEYRGCNQFTMAIIDEKTEFGTSIHRIDTRIDHGEILFQQRFPVPAGSWVDELYHTTFKASVALFQDTLPSLIAGRYHLQDQKEMAAKYGSALHFRDEISTLKQIDFNWDAAKIERHIRATAMPGFEPPFAMIGDRKVYITTDRA